MPFFVEEIAIAWPHIALVSSTETPQWKIYPRPVTAGRASPFASILMLTKTRSLIPGKNQLAKDPSHVFSVDISRPTAARRRRSRARSALAVAPWH